MSARSAAYGSIAALKKIEKRKMETGRARRDVVEADPTRKKTADNRIPAAMNGRRRPKRVQMRSDSAPTVGWMTTPSMLRVLDSRPVMRSGVPHALQAGG